MDAPFVSIIMNCYNGETYLREAVDSIIEQTYSNWELIFWDNQSTDGSAKIVHSYNDPRILYFYAPTHTDLGAARKKAAEQVSGEWLAFLDCDDLWLPDKLQKQIDLIEQEKTLGNQLGLVYGRSLRFGMDNITEPEFPAFDKGHPLPEGNVLEALLAYNFVCATNVLILRDAYLKVGGFPQDFKHAPDYFLSCAVAKEYPVRGVATVISKYRHHPNNLSRQPWMWSIANQETVRILKLYINDYPGIRKRILQIQLMLFRSNCKQKLKQLFTGGSMRVQGK